MAIKVAIHQPDFFPWLGNFNKMWKADYFIILDDSQYKKTGSNWSNRVKVIISDKADWINVPLERNYHGVRNYIQMKINNSTSWQEKIIRTLQTNYAKAEYFLDVFPWLSELICFKTESLLSYNLNAIYSITDRFDIDPSKFIMSSSLSSEGKATDYLISLLKSAKATSYICGGGASGYQEDEKFAEAGLELIYQNYQHPVYSQFNTKEFIPGLSIIDVLMNCGIEKTKYLIRKGNL